MAFTRDAGGLALPTLNRGVHPEQVDEEDEGEKGRHAGDHLYGSPGDHARVQGIGGAGVNAARVQKHREGDQHHPEAGVEVVRHFGQGERHRNALLGRKGRGWSSPNNAV